MPRFVFRLATLLRLREVARDQRRGELAEAQRADDLLRARQEGLAAEWLELQQVQRARACEEALDVDWHMDSQRYQMTMLVEQQQIAADRQRVGQEIEKRRQALVDADREVRVLERLRELQGERHRAEEERREMKQIDETAGRLARSGELREEVTAWAD